MNRQELWRGAGAANREYINGKINFADLMGIIRDLAKIEISQRARLNHAS
jgi:hypothetical protein